MRKALVSLIATGAVAISIPALAQETAPAPEAVQVPTTMPPSDAADPTLVRPLPAAVDPAVRSMTQTYITPEVAPGAVVAEPEPAPPPPPPPPPTDPVTIAVLNAIERICKPLVHGGDLKALATPLGYKGKKDVYSYVVTKPYQVSILPQGSNKNVCSVEIDYALDQVEPIVVGLHNWAISRGWTLYRNDVYTTDLKRHTRSWELAGQTETEALVLVALKKADGSAMTRNGDHATILYSVTPTPAQ